ncbi:hypothetical protein CRENPOLYSF2_340013 [Crenothrix polyspora]|uniref:Uncharacterized protein n=1 Tax=Crenothrix polyspora TaxID=360316 RepID=A0A1R4HBH8_9GAMM|nr:hypothetical protein CRENPOLYSF2_340013 [Crenothrix polyspora]
MLHHVYHVQVVAHVTYEAPYYPELLFQLEDFQELYFETRVNPHLKRAFQYNE